MGEKDPGAKRYEKTRRRTSEKEINRTREGGVADERTRNRDIERERYGTVKKTPSEFVVMARRRRGREARLLAGGACRRACVPPPPPNPAVLATATRSWRRGGRFLGRAFADVRRQRTPVVRRPAP